MRIAVYKQLTNKLSRRTTLIHILISQYYWRKTSSAIIFGHQKNKFEIYGYFGFSIFQLFKVLTMPKSCTILANIGRHRY